MTQQKMVYEHVQIKSVLHYVNVWFLPFKWGANTYRGCEHNCLYSNARYTHEYLGLPTGAFAHKILVKNNAAEVLDKEFSRATWRNSLTVNLATVTDPYQPAETHFKITRRVLEVFLKHHNALLITTKSDLILRDLVEKLKSSESFSLSQVTYCVLFSMWRQSSRKRVFLP